MRRQRRDPDPLGIAEHGFIAFDATSYHLPTAHTWMTAALGNQQTVGVFLFVSLASLSLGLIISGVRAITIDQLFCESWVTKRFATPRLNLDWSEIDEKKL